MTPAAILDQLTDPTRELLNRVRSRADEIATELDELTNPAPRYRIEELCGDATALLDALDDLYLHLYGSTT